MVYRRLKDLREDNDYTQTYVANYLGVSQRTYSHYEVGDRDIPTEVLIKLSKLYGKSIDYLLSK